MLRNVYNSMRLFMNTCAHCGCACRAHDLGLSPRPFSNVISFSKCCRLAARAAPIWCV